ncbi:MAG TPA: hypothetical protein VIJ87_07855, partial [Pyrinomonadaceae bacterium]
MLLRAGPAALLSRSISPSPAAFPTNTNDPFPFAAIRASPLWVVLRGAGADPCTLKPKKMFPAESAVIGVLTKTVLLKAAA